MVSFPSSMRLLIIFFLLAGCNPVEKKAILTPIENNKLSVCIEGCDFQRIQDAIDDEQTKAGSIIQVTDSVHTEAGIIINKNVTIEGLGAKNTVVQAHENAGDGLQRVFYVPAEVNASLRGMTIQHGTPRDIPLTGGGVMNLGSLTLEDVIVTENYASAGGGIYNEGTLTIINSSISNNGAIGGGEKYLECETGGGLKILTGTVTLINSSITGNQALGKGGGIHVACKGTLILQNSTVSGNYTKESGGGIFLNGTGEFTHSTISNNSANNVGGVVIYGSGEKDLIRGQLTLTNSIISNNIGRLENYGIADCDPNMYATIITHGENWIGDGTCAHVFSGDAMLGPLADNGGFTLTHGLLQGSPAIDLIPPENCMLDKDQRGEPRFAPCDIGAYEVQSSD